MTEHEHEDIPWVSCYTANYGKRFWDKKQSDAFVKEVRYFLKHTKNIRLTEEVMIEGIRGSVNNMPPDSTKQANPVDVAKAIRINPKLRERETTE